MPQIRDIMTQNLRTCPADDRVMNASIGDLSIELDPDSALADVSARSGNR